MSEIDPNSAIFGSEPQAEKRRATLKPKKKTPAYRPGRLNRRKRHLKRARDLVSNTVQRPSVPSITSTDTSIEGTELYIKIIKQNILKQLLISKSMQGLSWKLWRKCLYAHCNSHLLQQPLTAYLQWMEGISLAHWLMLQVHLLMMR